MRPDISASRCPVRFRSVEGLPPWQFIEELRSLDNVIWDEGMRSWVVVDYGRFRYVGSNQAVFTNAYAKQNPLFIEIECGPNTTPMQGEGRAAASAGRFSGVNDDGLPRNLKGAR